MTDIKPLLPFHIVLPKNAAQQFKQAIAVLSDLCTEVNMNINKDGLDIICIDPANVAMVHLIVPSTTKVEWTVKNPLTVGVNLNDLRVILKRLQLGETITLTNNNRHLRVTLNNTRHYDLPPVEISTKKEKMPDLKIMATLTMPSDAFRRQIEDADIVGESITFLADKSNFTIKSGQEETGFFETNNPGLILYNKATGKIAKSKYSVEYLKKMMLAATLSQKVTIEFSKDYPLRLTYAATNLVVVFVLAPRVDND